MAQEAAVERLEDRARAAWEVSRAGEQGARDRAAGVLAEAMQTRLVLLLTRLLGEGWERDYVPRAASGRIVVEGIHFQLGGNADSLEAIEAAPLLARMAAGGASGIVARQIDSLADLGRLYAERDASFESAFRGHP